MHPIPKLTRANIICVSIFKVTTEHGWHKRAIYPDHPILLGESVPPLIEIKDRASEPKAFCFFSQMPARRQSNRLMYGLIKPHSHGIVNINSKLLTKHRTLGHLEFIIRSDQSEQTNDQA